MQDRYALAYRMEITPNEDYIFLMKSQKVQMIDSTNCSVVHDFKLHNINRITISGDGRFAAFALESPCSILIYQLSDNYPLIMKISFPVIHCAIAEFINNDVLIAAAGNVVYKITISTKKMEVIYTASEYAICKSVVYDKETGEALATFNFSSIAWEYPFILVITDLSGANSPSAYEYQFDQSYRKSLEYGIIEWAYFQSKDEVVIGKSGPIYDVLVVKIENGTILPAKSKKYFHNSRRWFCSQRYRYYGVLFETENADVITVESSVANKTIFHREFELNSVTFPSICEYSRYLLVPQRKSSSVFAL